MASRAYLTPPQLAEALGLNPSKVLAWISRGELQAVNLATAPGGRPRWRIAQAAVDAFLAGRQATPKAKTPRRKRQPAGLVEYF